MSQETPPSLPIEQEVPQEIAPAFISSINHQQEIEHFIIPNHVAMLGEEVLGNATAKAIAAEKELWSNTTGSREVTYDKYKKQFLVAGENVTLGQLVASRHFDERISVAEAAAKTGDGKKLVKTYTEYAVRDVLTKHLNKDLAIMLSEKAKRQDMFKSKAYSAIASREGDAEESKQLGVVAEKMMQGIAEMISLDRPDLHLTVRPANAFQDVEEKIDFIITTKTKKRGVGIDTDERDNVDSYEEKNYGIQFTVNASATEHKKDQIEKAKGRATDVDDILLVSIDQAMMRNAFAEWNKNGRAMHGPWNYMPAKAKQIIIEKLFEEVLQKEEIMSLQKGI